ncbi:MAG: DNA translocase FtsK [Solobacterium sp.]|nr:DNA translocase FtsK [Solobacterium sp.]
MEIAEKKKAPEDETFFRRLIRKAGDILLVPEEEEEPVKQIPYKTNDRNQEEELPILQENGLRRIDVTGRYKTVEEPPRSFGLTADEEQAKEPEEPVNAFKPKSTSPKTIRRSRSGRYELPKPTLLEPSSVKNLNADNERAAQEKGRILIRILANFDINADMLDIHIGPSVTQFEIRPDANIKVSRISSLTDNIKMQLAAKDIRIEAPIPGRNAVGIEIPNEHKTIVRLRDLITKNDDTNPLMIYLGKDLYGRTVTCPINRMPHLLIAGATGSGKSVCMNAIILSLLLRTNPDDVKMLLVDPKKVEFTPYANIPHLIGPIINDAGKASNALKVICRIMDERYDMFAKARVRKIDEYNKLVESQTSETNEDGSPALKKMPYIVVIIDELADLMMVAGKDVENSIVRITQLARAAGIHMIIATQRPSVDVITGLIKSNVPARIAFAVSSGVDSRTILDRYGAERLLGDGDMLYLPMGSNAPVRVQGAFVSDSEVKTITDYVSSQAIPVYDDAFVLLDGIEGGEDFELVSGTEDTLYDQAKLFVIEKQKASTSLLQRNFGIGYNRAAKIIDQLERNGVIGPANGSKPREVFMKGTPEEDE